MKILRSLLSGCLVLWCIGLISTVAVTFLVPPEHRELHQKILLVGGLGPLVAALLWPVAYELLYGIPRGILDGTLGRYTPGNDASWRGSSTDAAADRAVKSRSPEEMLGFAGAAILLAIPEAIGLRFFGSRSKGVVACLYSMIGFFILLGYFNWM